MAQAFPTSSSNPGMSLRDYFAGQYVAGIVSNSNFVLTTTHVQLAEIAYKVADAMIETRKVKNDV